MANENVPAPVPTRSDDQILPFVAWVPIRKSKFVLDLQKKQKNLIFQISMDILQNTNFFRAFTASASVPAIYIQQFWNTHTYEAKIGAYSFQLDENRFILDANLLREGYTKEIHFVSRMAVNNLLRYPVPQMLWGIITSTNVDYAELIWEEFVQAMQTFLVDKANLSTASQKGKKTKPHVIPYCRFTKLIICHLGRTHNIHQRSASPFHLAEEDHRLGNLKFVPKGEDDEVFGMQIPKELITNNIRNPPYYNAYMEMVVKHDQKTTAEEGGKKKSAIKADKSKKPTIAKQFKPKPVKEKSSKPAHAPKPKSPLQLIDEDEPTQPKPEPEHQGEGEEYDVEQAIQISLESFQAQGQAHVGGVAIQEPVAEATRPLPVVEGKGKAIATEEQAAQSLLALHTPKRRSITDQFIFQRRTSAIEEASTGPSTQPQDDASKNIVYDSPSPTDAKTGADTDKTNSEGDTKILQIGEEQGEDVDNQVNLEEKTAELDQGQVGSDPGKTPESRPLPEQVLMEEDQAGPDLGQSHVALAGPNPKPMHDEFVATVYP
ncbi:hypothetical protein Tco_1118567 [Tanacetum coccineum]